MGHISYAKLRTMMKTQGFTTNRIEREKIVGQKTMQSIRTNGHITTKTIATFCKVLNCQPGDIIEYVADDEVHDENT